MLTGLGLRNFKAFGNDSQPCRLSKITLIYGPNSGGKSSILQALLLLKESFGSASGDYGEMSLVSGDQVDLGGFLSLVHMHDPDRKLNILVEHDYESDECKYGVLTVFSNEGNAGRENPFHSSLSRLNIGIMDADRRVIFTGRFDEELVEVYPDNEDADGDLWKFAVLGESIESQKGHSQFFDNLERTSYSLADITETLAVEKAKLQELVRCIESDIDGYKDGYEGIDYEFIFGMLESGGYDPNYHLELDEVYDLDADDLLGALDDVEGRIMDEEEREEGAYSRPWGIGEWREGIKAKKEWLLTRLVEVRQKDLKDEERKLAAIEADLEVLLKLEPDKRRHFSPGKIIDGLEGHLNLINYLGPLRSAPKRSYKLSQQNDASFGITGAKGEFSANAIYRDDGVKKSVNDWFATFELPYKLDVIPWGDPEMSSPEICITLHLLDRNGNEVEREPGRKVRVTLADVGFGINQLLPIITEGVASPEGSIICVEQPELHLHPYLQAEIADLMIDTIADDCGKRKQWIVETHSELLIRRIQRRMKYGVRDKEGKRVRDLTPDDVSVIYVDPGENGSGSTISEMRLSDQGRLLDPWPRGFFAEAFNEAFPEEMGDNEDFEDFDLADLLG